jgi:hypothetical protein
MALDTNIALGVKPIEQPNMLAQMGQMMQLRQMQQENESNNALRDFYAQGGDINKAEDRQRLMSRAPMQGQKILGQESERRARDVTTLGKEYDNARVGLTNINDENGYYNWVQSSFNNPAIAAHLAQMGITPEKALANARATVAKEGLGTAINKSAMGISEFIKQDLQLQNATKNANIAAAPGHRNATVAEQKFAIEKAQQAEIDKLMGGGTSPTTPMTFGAGGGSSIMIPPQTNALIQGSTPSLSPNMLRPDAQAPAAAPTAAPVAATGDVLDQIKALDAKIAPLVNSGNPRATAIVQQLIAQRTQLLASAKNQYGGQITTVEVPDPTTGQPTLIQMRPNERGVLQPVKQGDVPLSVDATAGSNLTIDPSVARPAPTAAVVKERQAVAKLPEAIAMNTDAIRKIDEMIGGVDAKGNPLKGTAGQAHPGLSKATGLGGGVMRFFAGTEGKNFEIRHKEVLSQAFLDAFEALKGGGSITEKEGEKATAARTRMDLAQSKDEYIEAAREYQGVLKRGVENARARMQRSGTTPTTSGSGTQKTISRTGTFNGRKVIEYSDGTTAYAD